jgi:ADP-heptose:LPS heptosyltransferase
VEAYNSDRRSMIISSSTHGLGDTLLLTGVVKHLKDAVVELPTQAKRFEILFDRLAKVEIKDERQIWATNNVGAGHYTRQKLRNFFGPEAECLDIRPLVLYSDAESELWAREYLADKDNPVIVCAQVAKEWTNVRGIPTELAKNIIENLKQQGATPIVIQSNTQEKWAADTLNDLELKKLICLMRQAGQYAGANTGLYHLAVAVGAKVDCFQPQDSGLFNSSEWSYDHPTISHYTWKSQ